LVITSKQFSENTSYAFEMAHDIEILKTLSNYVVANEEWVHYYDESAYLGFTSGSTGTPKGFIRSHGSWLTSFSAAEQIFQYHQEDIILAPGPLCHSLSLFGAAHALHMGAAFHLTTALTPEVLSKSEATVVYAVPTMIYRLVQQKVHPIRKRITFLLSGEKLLPELRINLETVFPESVVYEYYGASELSFISYASKTVKHQYPDSDGRAFPGVRVTIRDQERERVPN